ncbi:MAG: 2-oxo acid dehydrogenase subunit E2 [Thermoplasmatota archaeon]
MARPDGKVVRNLPTYRRMMPYFLRHKYESLYYWEYEFDAEPGLAFAERMSGEYGEKVTLFHLFLHSLLKTFAKYPGVNRFAKGGKIYDRHGIWFSFSVKKEFSTEGKVSIVKREFKPEFSLLDTIKTARKEAKEVRTKGKDQGEKEAKSYLFFPAFLIRLGFPFYKFMDEHGLFTRRYMEKEVLYSSAFVNNVGSFGANTAYHHLYEIGTITNFYVLGAVYDKVVAENGKPVVRKVYPVKATVDERAEDGYYYFQAFNYFKDQLEHPEKLLEPCERPG